jgi:hypothetical protein
MDFGVIAMTTLKIQLKPVYGKIVAYPLCEQSKLFAKIAGTSTLTMETIKHIQALGFGFDCQQYSLENAQ